MTGTVGVDFGTATTLVSEQPTSVLPLGHTTNWLPSLVYVDGAALRVGEDAEQVSPELVLRSVKRAITDRRETFTVRGADGPIEVAADDAIVAVLREAVARADRAGVALSGPRPVRLGCPAMWDGGQRHRLLELARQAGLATVEAGLVDEPVAAGVAWLTYRYLAHGERPAGRLLVFDMGGGTLDVAVLTVVGGPRPQLSVQSCLGVSLAGDALDAAIARDLARELRLDIADHAQPELAWALLERAAREAKVRLSHVDEHPVVLPRQLAQPHVLRYRREQLEAAFAGQLDGAESLILSALRGARLADTPATAVQLRALGRAELTAGVDFVLLVGGMSRIPCVAKRMAAFFPHATVYDDVGVAPEEAVVAGLADPAGYDRIGLHRPAFDFVLDTAFGRASLYEAYTPLYEPWQVYSGLSGVRYERWLRSPDIPGHGFGTLRAVSGAGEPLRLRLDGQVVDGLPIRLGPAGITFGLSCDGRVDVVDGHGEPLGLRADGWPAPGREPTGPALRRLT